MVRPARLAAGGWVWHRPSARTLWQGVHALFGRDAAGAALGSSGDIAIFSLRKHLPVPNGGLLVLRHGDARDRPPRPTSPHLAPTAKSLAWLAAIELEHRWPRGSDGLRRLLGRPGAQDIRDPRQGEPADPFDDAATADGQEFDRRRATWGASRLSRLLYRTADPEDVRARRMHHHRMLLDLVGHDRGVRPLCADLPEGASPWLFPVLADAPGDFRRHLLPTAWHRSASGGPVIPRSRATIFHSRSICAARGGAPGPPGTVFGRGDADRRGRAALRSPRVTSARRQADPVVASRALASMLADGFASHSQTPPSGGSAVSLRMTP